MCLRRSLQQLRTKVRCELISCRRNGDRIRYDYGKYAVDVRIKRDHIEVDYQD